MNVLTAYTYEPWLEKLQRSPVFRGVDRDGLLAMLNCLKPRLQEYRSRDVIAMHGQPFTGVGIIAEGKVALTRDTYSGDRVILELLESPEIFGETAAFSDNPVWPATVIAQENSSVFFLPADKITGNCANVCPAHKALINNILRIVAGKALETSRKIEHLSARSVRGKISSYLLAEYEKAGSQELTLPMKRHELADYLGIPRPSLSRELGLLRDEGILEFDGRRLFLRDILSLEQALS